MQIKHDGADNYARSRSALEPPSAAIIVCATLHDFTGIRSLVLDEKRANLLADIGTGKTSIGSKTLMDVPCVHTKAQIDDQDVEEQWEQVNARNRRRSAEEQALVTRVSAFWMAAEPRGWAVADESVRGRDRASSA